MFRVTIGNRTLGFTFRHQKTEVLVVRTKKQMEKDPTPVFRDTMGTYCEIWEIKDKKDEKVRKWINERSAILGIGDTFTRAGGRKRSLARALKYLSLNKGERTKVWEAYHEAHSSERWDSHKLVEGNVGQVTGPTLITPESESKGVGERYANEMD